MAEANNHNRPLSPHVSVYRFPLTVVLSILHRVTGVGLTLGAILIVWWFMAAAVSPSYFDFVDGILTSWPGMFVLICSLLAFWFHFFNGMRHLRWDAGKGMGVGEAQRSSWRVILLTLAVTTLSVILLMQGA